MFWGVWFYLGASQHAPRPHVWPLSGSFRLQLFSVGIEEMMRYAHSIAMSNLLVASGSSSVWSRSQYLKCGVSPRHQGWCNLSWRNPDHKGLRASSPSALKWLAMNYTGQSWPLSLSSRVFLRKSKELMFGRPRIYTDLARFVLANEGSSLLTAFLFSRPTHTSFSG